MPRPLIFTALILLSLSLVPMACVVASWTDPDKTATRIQIVPDMDAQASFKPQSANAFFDDGRGMRAWPEGTVPRRSTGEMVELPEGMRPDSTFVTTFPIPVTEALVERGRRSYDIYCAACHGLAGQGDGMVHRRAESLQQGTWTPPSNLTTETVIGREHGYIYQVISHGVRNMSGYGHLIPEQDRWAIVAYVRALQRARTATIEDVPEDKRRTLR
jgi:mono/diheme cytochrome c family protein